MELYGRRKIYTTEEPTEDNIISLVNDAEDVPGIKIGTGNAFVLDLPFIDIKYARHIADNVIHITQEEREFWNNKVTAFIAPEQSDRLVLSKNAEDEYHA